MLSILVCILLSACQSAARSQSETVGTSLCHADEAVPQQLYDRLVTVSKLASIAYCLGREGIQKPFSCLSYCNEFPDLDLIQTWDTGITMNSCGYIAASSELSNDPTIYVIFRGTSSLANILSDLQASPSDYTPYTSGGQTKCTDCIVHTGFMLAWNATRNVIMPQLEKIRAARPHHRFLLAGHSLGGAVAGLAGLELRQNDVWGDVEVVTFGEPMFTNKQTATFLDNHFNCQSNAKNTDSCRYNKVVRSGDPIPYLPPMAWGWQSHSGEIIINEDGLCPSKDNVRFCRKESTSSPPNNCQGMKCTGSYQTILEDAHDYQIRLQAAQTTPSTDHERPAWQPIFAHLEYFSRMGLCFDPDWKVVGIVNTTSNTFDLK